MMTDDRLKQSEEGVRACPFIAFEGDQDHRADRPDYRHRCFAVGQPEPRALPHQERYCLTAAFTGCAMFLDWARQEAAATVPSAASSAGSAGSTAGGATKEDTPAFLAGRPRAAGPGETPALTPPGAELAGGVWQPDVERREDARQRTATASNRAVTLDTTPLAASETGQSMWEKPRRVESFPRLRPAGRRSGTPPLFVSLLALAVIMVALLVYPILTSQKKSNSGVTGPSATASELLTEEPTGTPEPSRTLRTHIVQKGEYLQSIANRWGVTWQEIAALNGISISNPTIYPGQKLAIPWPSAEPSAVATPTATPPLSATPSGS
jgi:LysM repeat protein